MLLILLQGLMGAVPPGFSISPIPGMSTSLNGSPNAANHSPSSVGAASSHSGSSLMSRGSSAAIPPPGLVTIPTPPVPCR